MKRIMKWAALGLMLASAVTVQARSLDEVKKDGKINIATEGPVSYTHLTLPTNREV